MALIGVNKSDNVRLGLFNARVGAENLIQELYQIIGNLKELGIDDLTATKIACQSFPTRNGGLEWQDPRKDNEELASLVAVAYPQGLPLYKLPPLPKKTSARKKSLPPEQEPQGDETTAGEKQAEPSPQSAPLPPKPERPQAPPAPRQAPQKPVARDDSGYPGYSLMKDAKWRKLLESVPINRAAPERLIISWAFNNVGNLVDEIKSADVPCRGALILLMHAKATVSGYEELLGLWSRTLPNQAALRADARFNDDGRTQNMLLDQFSANLTNDDQPRFELAGTEESSGKH